MTQKKTRARIQVEGAPTVEGIIVKYPSRRSPYYKVWGTTLSESNSPLGEVWIPAARVLMWQELKP